MNIYKGIQIDAPNIFVPWAISENKLVELFKGKNLKHITEGYDTIKCSLFNGLNCIVGFHFDSRLNGHISEFEFFRSNYDDQQGSFDEFQKYFVQTFGMPTITTPGYEGFNNHEWIFDNIKIIHLVYDRFGPEEHMRIKYMPLHSKA